MPVRSVLSAVVFLFLFISPSQASENFPFLGEVTTDNVNIRSGGDVNFESLGQMDKGSTIVVLDKKFDWFKIKLPDQAECYISGKFLKMRWDQVAVVVGDRVNLRAGPGEKFTPLGQLNKDVRVKVKGETGGWFQIEPPEGSYGWIGANFVTFKSAEIPAPKVVMESSRSIYGRQRLEKQESDGSSDILTAQGRLEDLGRIAQSKDVRYKLVVDEEPVYYLAGDQSSFEASLHRQVQVKGIVKPKLEGLYKRPVIEVSEIKPLP